MAIQINLDYFAGRSPITSRDLGGDTTTVILDPAKQGDITQSRLIIARAGILMPVKNVLGYRQIATVDLPRMGRQGILPISTCGH